MNAIVLMFFTLWGGPTALSDDVVFMPPSGEPKFVKTATFGTVRALKAPANKIARGNKSRLKVGARVLVGESVQTGKGGFVRLQFADGGDVRIQGESEVKMTAAESSTKTKSRTLDMAYGALRARVQGYDGKKSRFRVRTPVAVSGVRGTDFYIAHNRRTGASEVTTFAGRVAFGGLDGRRQMTAPRMIEAGFTGQMAKGVKQPRMRRRPKRELDRMKKSAEMPSRDQSAGRSGTRDRAKEKSPRKEFESGMQPKAAPKNAPRRRGSQDVDGVQSGRSGRDQQASPRSGSRGRRRPRKKPPGPPAP